MPPRVNSRHTFTRGLKDEHDALYLTDPEPFGYRVYQDNRQHVVHDGDTLFSLAARYFAPIDRAAGLWWIIADFQPEPIVDPTIALETGRILYIPSLRTVHEDIFAEDRREEA